MARPLRIGIVAGEMSGDILGAGLMAALKRRSPGLRFEGIGGPLMEAEGLASRVPMDRLSVMGLVEPLKRLPELLRLRRDLARGFRADPPDLFIGIDSPDFCLGLERRLREAGIPTVHYVSPSVWAWRQRRIHGIRRAVDLMLCLFPFEEDFYRRHGVAVTCVGHPLADEIPEQADQAGARRALGLAEEEPVLALLPGSRHGEVERLARPFLEAARRCRRERPELRILLSAASAARRQQLEALLAADFPGLEATLVTGDSRRLMAAADVLLLASGTATLEGLLLKKPMIVCYRMAPLSYAIISRLLKVPYFSLPNLLLREKRVPEFVQDEVNADTLFEALRQTRDNRAETEALKGRFADIHRELKKNASERAAEAVLALISTKS